MKFALQAAHVRLSDQTRLPGHPPGLLIGLRASACASQAGSLRRCAAPGVCHHRLRRGQAPPPGVHERDRAAVNHRLFTTDSRRRARRNSPRLALLRIAPLPLRLLTRAETRTLQRMLELRQPGSSDAHFGLKSAVQLLGPQYSHHNVPDEQGNYTVCGCAARGEWCDNVWHGDRNLVRVMEFKSRNYQAQADGVAENLSTAMFVRNTLSLHRVINFEEIMGRGLACRRG